MKNHRLIVSKCLLVVIICSAGLAGGCKFKQGSDSFDGSLSVKNVKDSFPTDDPALPARKGSIKEKLKKLPPASPQEQRNSETAIRDFLDGHPEEMRTFHEFAQLLDLKEDYFINECASIAGGKEAFEGFMEVLEHAFDQPAEGKKTLKEFREEYTKKKNKGKLSREDKKAFKRQKEQLETVFKTFIREVRESQAKNLR